MVTWPSPAITVLPFLETPMMVVPCQRGAPWLSECPSMARDMGRAEMAFKPSLAAGVAAVGPAGVGGADLTDVAEQILQEAALAPERRRLVAVGADPHDLLDAGPVGRDDVAGLV